MKTQFPVAPPERLIEDTGDGLKSLRFLRDQYLEMGWSDAAARIDTLIGTTAVDPTEPIASDDAGVIIGQFADFNPARGAAIDHAIATGEGLFA
jgi:hypothetical protein